MNVALLTRDTAQNVALLERPTSVVAPTITTTALPDGQVGVAYSQTIQHSGSQATFSVASGSLPSGLALNTSTGTISGTPTAPVNASFSVTATNSAGTDTKALSIIVPNSGVGSEAPAATTVAISPESADIAQGETIDLTLTVTDDGTPIPNIAGSATSSDVNVATVSMLGPADEFGLATAQVTPGLIAGTATITVAFDGIQGTSAVTVTETAVAPTMTDTTLPSATVGVAYSKTLAATGTLPIAFAITAGALPAGLTLSSAGTIFGAPSAPGTASFTVTATNVKDSIAKAFAIIVAPAGAITGVTVSPDSATIDVAGQAQFAATVLGTGGFSSAIAWSVVSGGGTISASGLYTAPGTATTATIRATSVQDPTQFADATVTVQVPGVDTLHIPGIRIAAWVGTQRTQRVHLTTSGGSEGLTVTATSSDPSVVAVTPSAVTNAGGIAEFTVNFVSGGTALLSFSGEGMSGALLAVSRTSGS